MPDQLVSVVLPLLGGAKNATQWGPIVEEIDAQQQPILKGTGEPQETLGAVQMLAKQDVRSKGRQVNPKSSGAVAAAMALTAIQDTPALGQLCAHTLILKAQASQETTNGDSCFRPAQELHFPPTFPLLRQDTLNSSGGWSSYGNMKLAVLPRAACKISPMVSFSPHGTGALTTPFSLSQLSWIKSSGSHAA